MHRILLCIFIAISCSFFLSCKTAKTTSQSEGLYAGVWQLSSIKGQPLSAAVAPSAVPSLQFQTDGTLLGFTGCNRFNGRYNPQAKAGMFEPGAMTKMYCEGSVENEFLALLQQSDRISIKGKQLILFNANDMLMSFIQP